MAETPKPFENYHPDLFPRIRRAGEFLSHFILGPHLFASHGDHFVHPLDDTFERPAYTEEAGA